MVFPFFAACIGRTVGCATSLRLTAGDKMYSKLSKSIPLEEMYKCILSETYTIFWWNKHQAENVSPAWPGLKRHISVLKSYCYWCNWIWPFQIHHEEIYKKDIDEHVYFHWREPIWNGKNARSTAVLKPCQTIGHELFVQELVFALFWTVVLEAACSSSCAFARTRQCRFLHANKQEERGSDDSHTKFSADMRLCVVRSNIFDGGKALTVEIFDMVNCTVRYDTVL